jgi:hypothetical protein
MKSEIPVDQAVAGVRAPRASPRAAPTVTMHHKVNGIVCDDKRFSYIGHFRAPAPLRPATPGLKPLG